jgi:hypothetical protein
MLCDVLQRLLLRVEFQVAMKNNNSSALCPEIHPLAILKNQNVAGRVLTGGSQFLFLLLQLTHVSMFGDARAHQQKFSRTGPVVRPQFHIQRLVLPRGQEHAIPSLLSCPIRPGALANVIRFAKKRQCRGHQPETRSARKTRSAPEERSECNQSSPTSRLETAKSSQGSRPAHRLPIIGPM